MRCLRRSFWVLLLVLSPLSARAGDTHPDRVLGQATLFAGTANMIDRRGLNYPAGIAIDTSVTPNRLYVADELNNRVLGWRDVASLRNGEPADLVLGQTTPFTGICNTTGAFDFGRGASTLCHPARLAVDRAGNLYVADSGNNRVLEYDSPFTTDTVADRLFGQRGFSDGDLCTEYVYDCPTASSLNAPGSLALDAAGNLYVADTQNNRVVRYDAPLTTDAVADKVYGQAEFDTAQCNFQDAGALCYPTDLEVDSAGRLWIVVASGRILEYDAAVTGDTVADRIFATEGCSYDQPRSASTFCGATALAFDPAGNLYVVSSSDARVLEFDGSLLADAVADRVLGQPSFAAFGCNRFSLDPRHLPGADTLCAPADVATDSAGNLYVVDRNNSRVLVYRSPLTDLVADVVLGQIQFDLTIPNSPDRRGLSLPQGVAVDRSVSPNRLYVTDMGNQRVLGWRDAEGFKNGAAADLVIENLLLSNDFVRPGLAVDSQGNLYVPDVGRNRVLEYDSPFETDTKPDRVFGRGRAPGTGCGSNIGPHTLCYPADIAVDAAGNVFILDAFHNRVLWYRTPLSGDTVPDRVYGQQGSFFSGKCNKGGLSADSLCPLECRDVRCHNDYTEAGLALDEAGNLYVSDYLNHRVLLFKADGDTTADRVFGQKGSFRTNTCLYDPNPRTSLCWPAGLAIGPSGDLYVADSLTHRVVRYGIPLHRERIRQTFQGDDYCDQHPTELCVPVDVALDDEEDLFVVDPFRHRVLAFDADH